jgi:hypothetical protein
LGLGSLKRALCETESGLANGRRPSLDVPFVGESVDFCHKTGAEKPVLRNAALVIVLACYLITFSRWRDYLSRCLGVRG